MSNAEYANISTSGDIIMDNFMFTIALISGVPVRLETFPDHSIHYVTDPCAAVFDGETLRIVSLPQSARK